MMINQPRWKKVEYSRSQIIKAGKTIKKDCSDEEKEFALKVIDNWRAAHAYPLQVVYMHLKRISPNDERVIVAQRLKRLDSIVGKLQRENSMSLWNMQDLGGCRCIANSVDEVYSLYKKYKDSRIRHRIIREDDYIKNPKSSGYRSLHVVYEFHSDTNDDYNKNMLIEVQFRTHLQHLWATAVETMGLFTNQAIKAGHGTNEVKRFFELVSALFAKMEETNPVPNTPYDLHELASEIKAIDDNYNFLNFLTSIRVVTKFEEEIKTYSNGYCVLTLMYDKKQLIVKRFMASEIDEANKYYSNLEKGSGDTVLVRVSSFSQLKKAYPNYFSDISEFVEIVRKHFNLE